MMVMRLSIPIAARIAWLKSFTPLQAIFTPEGCALTIKELPEASILIALQASVGSE